MAHRIRPVGAGHYIGLGEGVHQTGPVVGEEHPIDPAVAAMHSVLVVAAAAALRTVLEVHHIGLGEVVDVVHNPVEGEEHHNLAEGEEHHVDLEEGSGLVVARHMVLGHSLVEADNRPAEGTVGFALVVVVDTVDIEAVVRIPGVEGLGPGVVADSLPADCNTTCPLCLWAGVPRLD